MQEMMITHHMITPDDKENRISTSITEHIRISAYDSLDDFGMWKTNCEILIDIPNEGRAVRVPQFPPFKAKHQNTKEPILDNRVRLTKGDLVAIFEDFVRKSIRV